MIYSLLHPLSHLSIQLSSLRVALLLTGEEREGEHPAATVEGLVEVQEA